MRGERHEYFRWSSDQARRSNNDLHELFLEGPKQDDCVGPLCRRAGRACPNSLQALSATSMKTISFCALQPGIRLLHLENYPHLIE